MMGKTHIFCGIAAALAISRPDSPEGCITAIIGGAAGGIISDMDMRDTRSKDTIYSRLIAAGIIAAALLTDLAAGIGVIDRIKAAFDRDSVIGAGIFIALCIFGILQPHRKFTHSIVALCLYSSAVGMMHLPLCIPFAAGFASHIALDFLNKKPIMIFWPIKAGICLSLCYSNKFADKLLLFCGVALSLLFTGGALLSEYIPQILAFIGI